MRHNRRAVMAERHRLYMKRNVLNGKYFVRNVQIVLGILIMLAVIIGAGFLINSNKSGSRNTSGKDGIKINVKDALFGNNDVTENELTADKEEADDKEAADKDVSGDTEESFDVISEITDAVEERAESENADIIEERVESDVAVDITTVEDTGEAENAIIDSEIADSADLTDEDEEGEFANRCIANVDETLNVRKDPSRDAEFVGMMTQGSIATVIGNEGEWTKIKSGEVEGYVLSEYVLTGKCAEIFSKDYVTIQGKALEDGVNVREDRSTDADILKVLDKDDIIKVVEIPEDDKTNEIVEEGINDIVSDKNSSDGVDKATEMVEDKDISSETSKNIETDNSSDGAENTVADTTQISDERTEVADNTTEVSDNADEASYNKSDDITWITVMLDDGQIGYVAQDYIDIDKLYTIAVSAEELQRQEEERAAAEREAAEAAILAAQQAAAAAPAASYDNSSSYHGATTTPITAASSGESLGTFYITAYCGCEKCSGGHNKTASGTTPTQGRTIAADTSVLPFGTQVVIDGIVYTVEDRGSGICGNHIDIFFATHEDAMAYGSKSVKVYKY